MPPVYFFAIDVSQAAYACGMVAVAAATIKDCLDKLPGDERTMVGFLTYDSSLHFYNIKANLAAPQVRQAANGQQAHRAAASAAGGSCNRTVLSSRVTVDIRCVALLCDIVGL